MSRRTVLLIIAILVAALGTFLIYQYVSGINDRALEDQEPVEVLVVTQNVAAGASGDAAEAAGAFELKTVARNSVAEGALSSVEPIRQLVALTPLFPGEQVLQQKFGAQQDEGAAIIPEGKIAVSVQLGDPERVAALLRPGSNVAIFVTGDNEGVPFTRALLPTVPVVATGDVTTLTTTTTDASGTQTQTELPVALLTLGVTQKEAEKIIFAQSQGQLYFGLLTDSSEPIAKDAGTVAGNLFN